MNSLPTQAVLGFGTVVLATFAAATLGSAAFAIGLVVAVVAGALACVAFAAQAERFRDEARLVYRPVYVRRHDVQRRVMSDD